MANRTSKGRVTGYDHITVGLDNSTQERVISGSVAPAAHHTDGNGENIAVGSDYGEERHISGSTLMEIEIVSD